MTAYQLLRPLLIVSACAASACVSQPPPEAFDNETFYEYQSSAGEELVASLERRVSELDEEAEERSYQGVEILGGVARFQRPSDWVIRRGSASAEERFIEYVSPRQVVISIYERLESPLDSWSVVLERYLADTEAQGGQVQGSAVPLASFDSQGRAFDVRRAIPAGNEPLVSLSREYLLRSDRRVILVQLVRPRADFGSAEAELLQFTQSLSVL